MEKLFILINIKIKKKKIKKKKIFFIKNFMIINDEIIYFSKKFLYLVNFQY